MNREFDSRLSLEDHIKRVSESFGLRIDQLACCPTSDATGVADRRGVVIFNDDDPRKLTIAIVLSESIGEPASVNQQP